MEVEWVGEDKEELWQRQGEDGWLDFPGVEGEERLCARWVQEVGKCSACSCRGHTRNRIIDSPDSPLLFFAPRFLHGWRRDGDEANQGIMEELHTCAASPMLYYINREYSRTSTYPFSLYNRRACESKERCERRMDVGCEQTHVRASIVECLKESQRAVGAHPRDVTPNAREEEERSKHSLFRRQSVSEWLERKCISLYWEKFRRRRARALHPISIASQFIDRMHSTNFSRCWIMRHKRRGGTITGTIETIVWL